MRAFRLFLNILLILQLIGECFFIFPSYAAFDVVGVQLFKDNTICLTRAGNTASEGFSLNSLQSNQESIQSKVSSSGLFCPPPPFFTGGALLTTTPKTIQAQPNVQSLGRGILISEIAGNSSGVSSSGQPVGFNTLAASLGGLATTIFEISLPTGCDVIDDDDDIVGASSDLTTVNDFTLPSCTSTNGLTVQCNTVSGLLTAANGLVPASSGSPAKIRFVISAIDSTIADPNMIDSILISFDSQDIFCSSRTDSAVCICPNIGDCGCPTQGDFSAEIVAKNAVDNPTMTETIGTATLGTPAQAAKISYAFDLATSLKGEVSANGIGVTPLLLGGMTTIANKIEIEELNKEGIPISGQSSPVLINPSITATAENNVINLWLTPPTTNFFFASPSSSDISFSDNSLVIHSAPYIVMSNSDDLNAPFGTLVIPIRKNEASGATNPAVVKTKITINNLALGLATTSSPESPTVSLGFFEPISGAIVNTPSGLSVNNSTNPINPQNFSAFSVSSTRALAQNTVVGGAVNEATAAAQITTNIDLGALISRDTTLGAPQITGFTKIISSVTQIDTGKVTVSNSNSVLTISGSTGASIGGAKIKIDSIANGKTSTFDSVTITSKSNGSFSAKVQADFSGGDVTVNFKQTVSGTDSLVASKTIPEGSISCDKTVCGCENIFCTPNVSQVLDFVKNNGGLSGVISTGGDVLQEVINAAKKALGLS